MLFSAKKSSVSWMFVFLGNPGPKYDNTRHNAGFMVGDELAKKCGVSINRLKNKALTEKCRIAGEDVLLVKPQTFMNLSGEAVRPLADFYKVPPERILVVSDEVSLPIGKLRLRASGSAGGHNGLKNIIQHLGTDKFPRLRIGVGAPPHPDSDMADWVLATFRNQDAVDMDASAKRAAEALESCVKNGLDKTMTVYNR